MKKRALIAVLLVATSPAVAQTPTSSNQQALLPGQTGESALTQGPTTGTLCAEEMTATFCNVPTSPNTGGYGTSSSSGAASGGSGATGGLSANGGAGGNASALPPCPGEPPFNELCN
jgi:hypothetical protein